MRNKLHEVGIQTSVHYPAIHRFHIYRNEFTDLPITDYVVGNEITLPMYSKLKYSDVKYICDNLLNIIK